MALTFTHTHTPTHTDALLVADQSYFRCGSIKANEIENCCQIPIAIEHLTSLA